MIEQQSHLHPGSYYYLQMGGVMTIGEWHSGKYFLIIGTEIPVYFAEVKVLARVLSYAESGESLDSDE